MEGMWSGVVNMRKICGQGLLTHVRYVAGVVDIRRGMWTGIVHIQRDPARDRQTNDRQIASFPDDNNFQLLYAMNTSAMRI